MEAIRKQAFLTFTKSPVLSHAFEDNLNKLHGLMDRLTASDVQLDYSLLTRAVSVQRNLCAPVTYIEILEDPNFTINMFVLRPGSKLPLHDHPMMHGICKIVHGKVRIRNYTLKSDTTTMLRKRRVEAWREADLVVSEKDEAVLLTPDKRNIHEIEALDGPAAFVDVLAPPYRTLINGFGPRPCQYFVEVEEEGNVKSDVSQLLKTDKAPGYWTDCAPYLGP